MTISAQIFIAIQIIMDFLLVIIVVYLLKNMKTGLQKEASAKATDHVFSMIEPLLAEADKTAKTFGR